MSMQSIIMSRREWATWFMSTMKGSFWEKQGTKKALKRFQVAANRVPAYQQLLREHKINPKDITIREDYQRLPILDKKNYLQKYALEELCLDGKLSNKYLIDRSSGYSGTSFFWPRLAEEDKDYPTYMRLAYEQFYGIDRKSTLMIITLSLGSWVGGEKISWATREIALRGENPFTVITPGLDLDEILEIVKYFKNKYEQIVLVGYPPFVKTIIDEGERRGIDWKSFAVKIGLGGEGYSEDWREYIRDKIGMDKKDLMGIAGGYGAADLGMSVGREYPISVLIRKLANQNKSLARELFGEEGIPSFCQYNPVAFYIEAVENELVFSCHAGIPLVRYNIHDRGGVVPFARALEIVRSHGFDPIRLLLQHGYTKRDIWRLPFFYVYGRSDGTAIIDGTNVYPDNVNPALCSDEGKMIHSYQMEVKQDGQFNEHLYIFLELHQNIALPKNGEYQKLVTRLHDQLLQALCKMNVDYADAYSNNPSTCDPIVELYEYGRGPFQGSDQAIKQRYIKKGDG